MVGLATGRINITEAYHLHDYVPDKGSVVISQCLPIDV